MTGRRSRWLLPQVAVFAGALAVWQVLSATGVLDRTAFPSMTSTTEQLAHELATTDLWSAVGQTLEGWAIGMLVGCVLAVVVGTVLGSNQFVYHSVIPIVELLKTVPAVAILPLVIIVFGATLQMKIFLVAFAIFWPFTIQVIYGVRAVDPVVRDTAAALQLRGLRRFTTVTLPSAAPFVATGVRVASATGLILAVIAELIGGAPGLGQSILTAENAGPSQLPTMYAYILVTGAVGVVLTGLFSGLEVMLLPWHESRRNKSAGTT